MQMTDAINNYTIQQIAPLITQFTDNQIEFIPEAIPSLSAHKVVDRLKHNLKYLVLLEVKILILSICSDFTA